MEGRRAPRHGRDGGTQHAALEAREIFEQFGRESVKVEIEIWAREKEILAQQRRCWRLSA